MATPKLDEYAKILNEVIRYKLKQKTISTAKFLSNKDMYKKIVEDVYNIEGFVLSNNITAEKIQINLRNIYHTEFFFGIDFSDNKQLLWDLCCDDYYGVISAKGYEKDDEVIYAKVYEQDNEIISIQGYDKYDVLWIGDTEDNTKAYYELVYNLHDYQLVEVEYLKNIFNSYNQWKEYCRFVDEAKLFIKNLHPNYSKFTKTEKRKFINILEPYSFTKDIAELLDNYDLNKFKQAKIDKLLSLNLPNITDIKTATKLTELYIKQNL